ncbi:Rha family transcriptional regulator [Lentilactobacillus hilgardii]|nr:Rha family transcriptional regulator [Lentilactobacillus hilgardii]MCV3742970.1 Rha family transcriptional regulator [Lentilactobacillus hilgardii]
MNELVIMKGQQAVTTSLKVAQAFNKKHKDVSRAIANLKIGSAKLRRQMFSYGNYENRGKRYPLAFMNRDGFTLLAMGFTGKEATKFKLQYIEAFNKMENQIKKSIKVDLPQSPMETLKLMFQATEQTDKKVTKVEHRVTDLEDNQCLEPGEYNYISHRVRAAVSEYEATHHLLLTQKQRSKLYKDINTGLNQVTGIKTRTQLRKKDFDTADEYIRNWQPSTATLQIIKQLSGIAEGQMSLKNQRA